MKTDIKNPFTILKLKYLENENVYYGDYENYNIHIKIQNYICVVKVNDEIFVTEKYMNDDEIYYFENIDHEGVKDILLYISNNETAVAIFFKVSCFIIPELVSYDLIILNSMLQEENRKLRLRYAPKQCSPDFFEYYFTGTLIESLLSEMCSIK